MKKASKCFLIIISLVFCISCCIHSLAKGEYNPHAVSYTTYDTTYEKIIKMYLRVINSYTSDNPYGRHGHDLYNDMLFGGLIEWDSKAAINEVKKRTGYMLFDVNQDGIDELLIGSGGADINEVFTIDNGRVREIIRAGGYDTASSNYSCSLLSNGLFYRWAHAGGALDYYETWQMNGTGKVSFVEGYHTEPYWDDDLQQGFEFWYRSNAPVSTIKHNSNARVEDSVAEKWKKEQEWNIYNIQFVPFSVLEKFPNDPWNIAILSVKGAKNTTAQVNVRKKPDQNSKLVATKNVGTYVRVLSYENGYFRIAFGNKEGYIQQEYLTPLTYKMPAGVTAEIIEDSDMDDSSDSSFQADEDSSQIDAQSVSEDQTSDIQIGKTNHSNVNMRTKPDKKSKLVAAIKKKGTSVTVKGETNGDDGMIWYEVEYNGKDGFIRNDYIDLEEAATASSGNNGELYGVVVKKLATRSGPSPRAEDTGTYSVKGQKLRIYSRAYDPIENAWWVKCDVPYHGEIRTLWAWYTRFDTKKLPLESIPIDEDYR